MFGQRDSVGNSVGIVSNSATINANIVYDNDLGIVGSGGSVSGNRVFGNQIGMYFDGSVSGNWVFGNQIGILGRSVGSITDNQIYFNSIGIEVGVFPYYPFHGRVANNRVYANSTVGIAVHYAGGGEVSNNTVYQPAGDAIRLDQRSQNARLRNNILSVGDGYALFVEGGSQIGFDSDYNLFHVTGNGKLAQWQTVDFTNLDEWAIASASTVTAWSAIRILSTSKGSTTRWVSSAGSTAAATTTSAS